MKSYGNSRRDNLTCAYGCCTDGTVKTACRGVPRATIRAARKRARRQARSQTREAVQFDCD